MLEQVRSYFPNLGIAQSTIEELQEIIAEREGHAADGVLTVGMENGQIVKDFVPPERVQQNLKALRSLLEWVKRECSILPTTAALNLPGAIRDQLQDLLGQSSFDSIMIASEQG
jgi:hypothetical protein